MIVFLAVAALLVAAIALFMNRPEFGRAPRGERLERIWRSPNYRDGAFRNRHATPQLTSGKGWWATMYDFLFERKERNRPDHALPAVKTDLKALDPWEITNGACGYNATSRHIAYAGGVAADGTTPCDTRTPQQKSALEHYVRDFVARFPGAAVVGHNELAAKACPSFDVQAWLRETGIL